MCCTARSPCCSKTRAARKRFIAAPALDLAARGIAERRGGVLVGQQVGACRILSLLGAGGMGEVYRARDTRLGRDVAVKVLPAHIHVRGRSASIASSVRRGLLAALNHPHIAAIYSLEEIERGARIGPRDGGRAPRWPSASRAGRLEMREALEIARQLIDALDAAHARGIIHRDIKPANIKIAAGDMVKVLDFGLAKARAAHGDDAGVVAGAHHYHDTCMTRGRVVGTPAYMSPEQARGKSIDSRTDYLVVRVPPLRNGDRREGIWRRNTLRHDRGDPRARAGLEQTSGNHDRPACDGSCDAAWRRMRAAGWKRSPTPCSRSMMRRQALRRWPRRHARFARWPSCRLPTPAATPRWTTSATV